MVNKKKAENYDYSTIPVFQLTVYTHSDHISPGESANNISSTLVYMNYGFLPQTTKGLMVNGQ